MRVFQKLNALCWELQSSEAINERPCAYNIINMWDAYMFTKWYLGFVFFVRQSVG